MGPTWEGLLVGPDPGAKGRQNRAQRAASLGVQQGTHLSKNGMEMLIPDNNPKGSMLTPEAHVAIAKLLEHPFQTPPNLPWDLQFAANASVPDITSVRALRLRKAQRLSELAEKASTIDRKIWSRMDEDVKVPAGSVRLGFITVLTLILRWPDWQMTSLYTRGFRVAGIIEPSNIYPAIDSTNTGTLHELLDCDQANAWNQKLADDTKAYDHDKAVWDTAKDQLGRHLLSGPMTKSDLDKIFGTGKWRGIRRRGLLQNDKVRGIDNARSSGTNFAAWLQDTIVTSPHDIAIQILCWMFNGKQGAARFKDKQYCVSACVHVSACVPQQLGGLLLDPGMYMMH